ncbi:hypothetical protein [Jeotgalibacillus marinus]|uniref:Flagellar protein FliT n=1 Tax=Jeotgalibacillus marinus TaxID=86667 RepID=A0ABV3Q5Q0_9BACL
MSRFDKLLALHRSMLLFIRNEAKKVEREVIIERINDFHKERKPLIDQVSPPKTDEERTVVNQIIQFNDIITRFIKQSFDEVKKDIQINNKKKKHNQSYSDPYGQQRGIGGAFYDKKK